MFHSPLSYGEIIAMELTETTDREMGSKNGVLALAIKRQRQPVRKGESRDKEM